MEKSHPIVPLSFNTYGDDEIKAVSEVLESGMMTMGARCTEFEQRFANYLGVQHAIFVNSGSSANLLALFALANHAVPLSGGRRRLNRGDEVIVPAVTWSTSVWPIVQAGGIPVLVDVDVSTLQAKSEAIERAITRKTVAIMAIHILGNAAPVHDLRDLAAEKDLWLIEDTCEGLGTRHYNQFAGTFGQMGTFSFFFSHHMTTVEGGMIVTDDEDLAELLRCLRAHGWTRHLQNRTEIEKIYPDIDPRYLFINSGFNVRPTEINAALGLCQITRLDGFNLRRAEIARRWHESLAMLFDHELVTTKPTSHTQPAWFGFPVRCKDRATRDNFTRHLEDRGIETRPIVCGNLARQPAFRAIEHRISGSLAGADEIMDTGLYWGLHPMISDSQIEYVSATVQGFFS